MRAKKWIIAQPLSNPLKEEDLKLVEFDLPDELQPEGITITSHYLISILLYLMISSICFRGTLPSGLSYSRWLHEVHNCNIHIY